jgi:hypothetical protein
MSIQDLGAIGEFVGSIAVLVTLVYLAVQIRQNTRHIASASLQGLSDRAENRLLLVASDAELSRIWMTLLEGGELSMDERPRAFMVFASWVNDLEDAYRQFTLGMIPEQALNARAANLLGFMRSPETRAIFDETLSPMLDPDFLLWFNTRR